MEVVLEGARWSWLLGRRVCFLLVWEKTGGARISLAATRQILASISGKESAAQDEVEVIFEGPASMQKTDINFGRGISCSGRGFVLFLV